VFGAAAALWNLTPEMALAASLSSAMISIVPGGGGCRGRQVPGGGSGGRRGRRRVDGNGGGS